MSSNFASLFPPLNSKTLVRHYIPGLGAGSHACFGIHVVSPQILYRLVGDYDWAMANALFFNAHLGVGLYLYYRHHMKKVSSMSRVIYSLYGAVMFNFGSVLFWATTKAILPRHTGLRVFFAGFTSICLIAVGKEYLGYVDTLLPDD